MVFNSSQPIWLQVRDIIKKDIIKGYYKPGEKLLPVRSYAVDYDVNPNTVQRALISLQDIGLVVTKSTNGNFVTDDIILISEQRDNLVHTTVDNFIDSLIDLGIKKNDIYSIVKERTSNG